jgi:hypothetical protein
MIDYGHVFSVAESEKSDKLRTEKAERRKGTASGVRYYDRHDTARHNRAIGTRSTLVTQLIDI